MNNFIVCYAIGTYLTVCLALMQTLVSGVKKGQGRALVMFMFGWPLLLAYAPVWLCLKAKENW